MSSDRNNTEALSKEAKASSKKAAEKYRNAFQNNGRYNYEFASSHLHEGLSEEVKASSLAAARKYQSQTKDRSLAYSAFHTRQETEVQEQMGNRNRKH